MGAALRKLWPDADVKNWNLNAYNAEAPDAIRAQLVGCDLVVSQVVLANPEAPLAFQRLREISTRAVLLPVIVFNGFQPDCIYLTVGNARLEGPARLLHSGIIAGGYVLGLPEARVARLFNALTYATLGYFDAFGIARDLLISSFAASNLDLGAAIDDWLAREGNFMHTVNHPHIGVLSTIAYMVAVQAGVADPDSKVPEDVFDFLAHFVRWPTYPELARRLAVPKDQSDLFVRLESRTLDRPPEKMLRLPDVIGDFYAVYAQQDRTALRAALPSRILEGLEEVLAG